MKPLIISLIKNKLLQIVFTFFSVSRFSSEFIWQGKRGDLNENGPCRLISLNTWSLDGGIIWEGLGGNPCWEGCHWEWAFMLQKAMQFASQSALSASWLYFTTWAINYHSRATPSFPVPCTPPWWSKIPTLWNRQCKMNSFFFRFLYSLSDITAIKKAARLYQITIKERWMTSIHILFFVFKTSMKGVWYNKQVMVLHSRNTRLHAFMDLLLLCMLSNLLTYLFFYILDLSFLLPV